MTRVQIDLPDNTVQAARAAGLLTTEALTRLLSEALRKRQAVSGLLRIADEVADLHEPPMSQEEIQAEINAAREERRSRADCH